MRTFFYSSVLLFLSVSIYAQRIEGVITNAQDERPIDFANVYLVKSDQYVDSDEGGRFSIEVRSGRADSLVVTRVGFERVELAIPALSNNEVYRIQLAMVPTSSGMEVVVIENRVNDEGLIVEEAEDFVQLPNTTGNIESLLPHIALGVSSGTGGELSSQYNVRGGNYDENIILVNDFEIYRPQLVTSSQQEGLSFPNLDLINTLSFSSGGFSSRYGDKLSSVLDVRYKVPDSLGGSISVGLLGGSAHIEGSKKGKNERVLRFLGGARYRSNAYLLNSGDTEGEYSPRFIDLQAMLSYEFNKRWQLGYLTNFSSSKFDFIPESSVTQVGSLASGEGQELSVNYQGEESDQFNSYFNGLSLTHIRESGNVSSFYKLLLSNTFINERENLDIRGDYSLSQIDVTVGTNSGNPIGLIGRGIFHNYVKNYLDASVFSAQIKSGHEITVVNNSSELKTHFIQWGLGIKQEKIEDVIREFERLDSADYSLPHSDVDDRLLLNSALAGRNDLTTLRYHGYLSNTYTVIEQNEYEFKIEGGARFLYSDVNEEFYVNPRLQLLYKPLAWRRNMSFKLAGGLYYQPPFYREMWTGDGSLNNDLLSQKSAHVVAGWTYDFFGNKRRKVPYRLIMEAYYKDLWDLVYYDVDNVRIRYSGENNTRGYAYGVDARLNGELIPNAESWINLSFLKTGERIDNVQHVEVSSGAAGLDTAQLSYVPRPSDRRVQATFFLQDYFPGNENLRMNMKLIVGTGLPFGFPEDNIAIRNDFRYKDYYRLDLGFSFILFSDSIRKRKPNHLLSFTKRSWFDIQIFNLLDIQNVASNTWIKDISNVYRPIPNNLTSRRVNVQFKMEF